MEMGGCFFVQELSYCLEGGEEIMMKKLISAAIGTGLVLASVFPAFAASINIFNTGPSSNVTTRIDRLKNHFFNLSNTNTLTQTVVSNYNTGNNNGNNNTANGTVLVGNATTNETQQVEMNTSNVDIDLSDNATCNCTGDITINTTGPSSNTTAEIFDNRTVNVTVSNSGAIVNTLTTTVNTGNNSASNNTGSGTVGSGDIFSSNTITTRLNTLMLKIRM